MIESKYEQIEHMYVNNQLAHLPGWGDGFLSNSVNQMMSDESCRENRLL